MSMLSMFRAEIRLDWKDDARVRLVESEVVACVKRALEQAAEASTARIVAWMSETDPVIDDLPGLVTDAIRELGK